MINKNKHKNLIDSTKQTAVYPPPSLERAQLEGFYSALGEFSVLRVGLGNGDVLTGLTPNGVYSEVVRRGSPVLWFDSVDGEWLEVGGGDVVFCVCGDL